MTDKEICDHLSAIEQKLPEDALSARIALGCLLGEFVRLQCDNEGLRRELERRPNLALLRGGAA